MNWTSSMLLQFNQLQWLSLLVIMPSCITVVEFWMVTALEMFWIMLFLLLGMGLKMVLCSGMSKIVGGLIGEKVVMFAF